MVQAYKQVLRIGFYIRVGSSSQHEDPKTIVKTQENRLHQEVIAQHRLGNTCEVKRVFADIGCSARHLGRPKLQQLIRAAENGEINRIMVTDISRLSRKIRDFVEISERIAAHGCDLVSLSDLPKTEGVVADGAKN